MKKKKEMGDIVDNELRVRRDRIVEAIKKNNGVVTSEIDVSMFELLCQRIIFLEEALTKSEQQRVNLIKRVARLKRVKRK